MCEKIIQSLDKKGMGRGKAVKKKKGGESASDETTNNQYTLICGPVQLLLPHPGAECV